MLKLILKLTLKQEQRVVNEKKIDFSRKIILNVTYYIFEPVTSEKKIVSKTYP